MKVVMCQNASLFVDSSSEGGKDNKFIVECSGPLHSVEMIEVTSTFEEVVIYSFWAERGVVSSAETSVISTTVVQKDGEP
jgi:hypothetical protein